MAVVCARCGAKPGLKGILTVDLSTGIYHCPKCAQIIASGLARERQRQEAEDPDRQRFERLLAYSREIVVTTTHSIDGYRVTSYIGIESVEFVIGTGIFSEVSSEFADFFGRRSSAFEKKLRAAKETAMDALRFIAAEKGANAVIGVDLDYTEFSGNRVALIINGTLVVVEPVAPDR